MHALTLRHDALALLILAGSLASVASAAPVEPADPAAAVPAIRYDSVFNQYRALADEPASPDAVWKSANAAVAGTGHEGHSMNMPMSGPTQAPMAKPFEHAGHSMAEHKSMTMPMEMKTPESRPPKKAPVMNMQHGHGKGH